MVDVLLDSKERTRTDSCDRRIGTVVAPVIGSYAIFNHVGNDQRALQNVQWIYLAIACFVFLLAVVFYL